MTSHNLSSEDVKRLVYSYPDKAVTDELYSFGTMLLNEIGQRSGQIEAKAATTLGWATGVLAFLFSTIGQAGGRLNLAVAFMGGCAP